MNREVHTAETVRPWCCCGLGAVHPAAVRLPQELPLLQGHLPALHRYGPSSMLGVTYFFGGGCPVSIVKDLKRLLFMIEESVSTLFYDF